MSGPKLNPNLLQIPLYIAGKSIEQVQQELGLDEVTKLASNESPVGASPLAVMAARRMLEQAHRYPGIVERELRCKIAAQLDPAFSADNVVVGNGGTDILRMITQAFVFDGGNCVTSRATFPMYRIFTTTFGGTNRIVPLDSDYRQDLAAMAEQIDEDTRIVFLCSPNNPTGYIIGRAETEQFMARVPEHVVVVFDEAYCDFVTDPDRPDSLAYIKEGRNVLTVRSFSKRAGLANLRVGYLVGPAELAGYVSRVRPPFHTGDIALAAAAASLDDEAFRTRHLQAVWAGRAYLESALREMGLNCLSSQANFLVIVDPPLEPVALFDALLQRGIIVRPMAAFGMENGLRVSVGRPEENQRFVAALQKILEEKC